MGKRNKEKRQDEEELGVHHFRDAAIAGGAWKISAFQRRVININLEEEEFAEPPSALSPDCFG